MKTNFLRKIYKDSWETIKKSKTFIFVAIGLFLIISILGFIFPIFFLDEMNLIIQGLLKDFEGLSLLQTFTKIFFNNFLACISASFLGLVLGIVSIFNTLLNGYLLGYVGSLAVSEGGYVVLLKLLPHGIFELPAIFISLGMGLYLANSFLKNVINLKKRGTRNIFLIVSSLIFVPLIIIYSLHLLSVDMYSATTNPSIFFYIISINLLILLIFSLFFVFSLNNSKLMKDIKSVIKVLFFIVMPLLIIAGIIEGLFIFLI